MQFASLPPDEVPSRRDVNCPASPGTDEFEPPPLDRRDSSFLERAEARDLPALAPGRSSCKQVALMPPGEQPPDRHSATQQHTPPFA